MMTGGSNTNIPAGTATEPWMGGKHTELDALRRGVVHALELALEDSERWAAKLTRVEIELRPRELPSVAFHLRHMARSLDRLLTYAEDRPLTESQLALLRNEAIPLAAEQTLNEFRQGIAIAIRRVVSFSPQSYEKPRGIGRLQLPTTVGGLLVHCADHTQRHSGQMVTTAKLVASEGLTRSPAPNLAD